METPTTPNHPKQPLLCLSWGRVPSTDTPRLCGASSPRPLLWLAKKTHNKPRSVAAPGTLTLVCFRAAGSGLCAPQHLLRRFWPQKPTNRELSSGRRVPCTHLAAAPSARPRLAAAPVLTAPSVELNPLWKNPSGLFFFMFVCVFFSPFFCFLFFFPLGTLFDFLCVCIYNRFLMPSLIV